ncbi:MAG: hypothetical protein PHD95_02075 [Candidatus ainarchaeum sp.]|nr:hypothetical protein [Candidatus ainarchaeum sp.]
MPETAKPIVITRIEVLVHPFYTGISGMVLRRYKMQGQANAKKLAHYWGEQIQSAAKDPSAVLIVVPSPKANWIPTKQQRRYYEERQKKLLLFAKKALGQRFFCFRNFLQFQNFNEQFNARGFTLDKSTLHGKVFGEYLPMCVSAAQIKLCEILGINSNNLQREMRLSVGDAFEYVGGKRRRANPRKAIRRQVRGK